jgi:peptidoglycan-N-acetylglucosamine deacetylase
VPSLGEAEERRLMDLQLSTFARWRDNFDYAYENHPGGVLTHTVHGLVSGRVHAIMLLERFIRHMKERDDVWFATLSDICDCWGD